MEGFLLIDKPKTWTSHDVVAKMRGILKVKKIGHLGTLDPMATGLLVLAVSKTYTKKVPEHMGAEKDYLVELELGKVSDTYDLEGVVTNTEADLTFDERTLSKVLDSFWGKSMQMPPAFSAKKVNGVRAYKLARQGKKVELKAREVEMQGKDTHFDLPKISFEVRVSSGTYIRSLVHDIGEKLGCGAVMTALRRTRVGDFLLEDAQTIEEVIEKGPRFQLI